MVRFFSENLKQNSKSSLIRVGLPLAACSPGAALPDTFSNFTYVVDFVDLFFEENKLCFYIPLKGVVEEVVGEWYAEANLIWFVELDRSIRLASVLVYLVVNMCFELVLALFVLAIQILLPELDKSNHPGSMLMVQYMWAYKRKTCIWKSLNGRKSREN